jgi:transcriptional antiterminator NusG
MSTNNKTQENKKDKVGIFKINPIVSPEARWYIIHTYSGHEIKVANTLTQRVALKGLSNKIFTLFVPQQQKIVVNEGKKRSIDEKLFPGYMMVQMLMDDDSWYVVRSTPGVTGFVGMGSTPTPMSHKEVDDLMKFTENSTPKFEAKFSVGDSIKIKEGPFKDFLARVDEVNEDQGKVTVLVTAFGRETPYELEIDKVSRI